MLTRLNETMNRYHPRVLAGLTVKMKTATGTTVATAQDLSMAGLCLDGEVGQLAERVLLALRLPEDRVIVTGAEVKRRTAGKTAIEFDQLDWDDMFALARYLHPRLP